MDTVKEDAAAAEARRMARKRTVTAAIGSVFALVFIVSVIAAVGGAPIVIAVPLAMLSGGVTIGCLAGVLFPHITLAPLECEGCGGERHEDEFYRPGMSMDRYFSRMWLTFDD